MSDSFTIIEDHNGKVHELTPGDIIGRSYRSRVWIPDLQISEAHAMVSFRKGSLWLLALRGPIAQRLPGASRWTTASKFALQPGQEIGLTASIGLKVREMEVISNPITACLSENGRVYKNSLLVDKGYLLVRSPSGRIDIVPASTTRAAADALGQLWCMEETWMLRLGDASPVPVRMNTRHPLNGATLTFFPTQGALPTTRGTVELRLKPDACTVLQDGTPALTVRGKQAKMLWAIRQTASCPVEWDTFAQKLWPDEASFWQRRDKWHNLTSQFRRSLRSKGLNGRFLRKTGNMQIALCLPVVP